VLRRIFGPKREGAHGRGEKFIGKCPVVVYIVYEVFERGMIQLLYFSILSFQRNPGEENALQLVLSTHDVSIFVRVAT